MLTLSQLTPVCYVTYDEFLCIKCGDAAGLPTKDQMIEYSADEFAGNGGLYCYACSAEIVAPYTETEYCAEHGEVQVNLDDARCPICEQATSTTICPTSYKA